MFPPASVCLSLAPSESDPSLRTCCQGEATNHPDEGKPGPPRDAEGTNTHAHTHTHALRNAWSQTGMSVHVVHSNAATVQTRAYTQ